jgi:hypothetical protein
VPSVTGTGHRTARGFDGDKANAPLLHVEYRQDSRTASSFAFCTA